RRLLTFENSAGINAERTVCVHNGGSVTHQTASRYKLAKLVDRGHRAADRQRGQLFAPTIEQCIGADHEPPGSKLDQRREVHTEILVAAGMTNVELNPQCVGRCLEISRQSLGKNGISRVDERGDYCR